MRVPPYARDPGWQRFLLERPSEQSLAGSFFTNFRYFTRKTSSPAQRTTRNHRPVETRFKHLATRLHRTK
ncbi:hypothetical protein JS44_04300 [Anoxybacillus flavithermus]|uniref:Uncharacterized protein n=1 Tax=Anoxybacillus flavithermus TaxID=33934 RepID=A0A094IZH9_9BACL|nr:hypothetical protein JS44_04300 [Anoxybacillus flavithermus]